MTCSQAQRTQTYILYIHSFRSWNLNAFHLYTCRHNQDIIQMQEVQILILCSFSLL